MVGGWNIRENVVLLFVSSKKSKKGKIESTFAFTTTGSFVLCQTVLFSPPFLLLLRLVLSTVINQKNVKHHAVKKKPRLKWLSYHGSFVLRLPLSSWLIKKWNTTAVKKNTPRQMRVTRYKKTKREAAWSCREVTASHLLTHASPRASAIDDSLIDGGWVLAMLR